MLLSCISCNKNEIFEPLMATDDVVIANQVEINMKALRAVYDEVELISARIATGVAIDVVSTGNGWEYPINNNLLEGKIIVEYITNQSTGRDAKTVYCNDLKICYYPTVWLQLFGSFDIENTERSIRNVTNKVTASNFGFKDSNNYDRTPEITLNSNYTIQSNFNDNKELLIVKMSGSGFGVSRWLGEYNHEITKTIEPNILNYNIIGGTIEIFTEKLGNNYPVEIQYSPTKRTVKYKGVEQVTLYNN